MSLGTRCADADVEDVLVADDPELVAGSAIGQRAAKLHKIPLVPLGDDNICAKFRHRIVSFN